MKEKTIYDLELHEGMFVGAMWVVRVPFGWIYQCWDMERNQPMTGTFVPFNNEFQDIKK